MAKSANTTKQVNGFTLLAGLLIVLALVIAITISFIVHNHYTNRTRPFSNTASTLAETNPYVGWKTATSQRAKFSIKYPTNWTYNEAVGSKDNVEHITLDSSNFHITIDSYIGLDPASGGESATYCVDCTQTIDITAFTAHGLGKVALKTIVYTLDTGQGNALILTLPNSTYFIPSVFEPNVHTAFRGISRLDSEQAYQRESHGQFIANPDYKTAQKILESVSY